MWRLVILSVLLLSGCSYFTFNATMCDQIATDPNAVVPQECRNYNEEEAQKAFDKTKVEPTSDEVILKESIKFDKAEQ